MLKIQGRLVLLAGLVAGLGFTSWGWWQSAQNSRTLQMTVDKQSRMISEMTDVEAETVKETTEIRTNPDGSKVTRKEKTSTANRTETRRTDAQVKEKAVVQIPPKLSRYSLGLQYPLNRDSLSKPDWHDIRMEGGMRLGDTPFEATIGYGVSTKDLTLGIRFHF